MKRRNLLAAILGLPAAPLISGASSPQTKGAVLLQKSTLAGFQFHAGEAVWTQLASGQSLALVREPDNPYDDNAVRVDWRGQKLGYVARVDNTAVAQLLDRGERVSAYIDAVTSSRNPWERVRLAISLARA